MLHEGAAKVSYRRRMGFESPDRQARNQGGILGDPDDDDDAIRAIQGDATRSVSSRAPARLIHSIRLTREAAAEAKSAAGGAEAAALMDASHDAVKYATSSFACHEHASPRGGNVRASPMRFTASYKPAHVPISAGATDMPAIDVGRETVQCMPRRANSRSSVTPVRRQRAYDAPASDRLAPFLRKQARNSTRADALIADALGLEVSYDPRNSSQPVNRLTAPSVDAVVGAHEVSEHAIDGSGHVRFHPKSDTAPRLQFDASV